MLLPSFPHKKQRHESDCLVACVEMVLAYLLVPTTYDQIAKRLRTQWFGTPFGNIIYMESLGLRITLAYQGTIETFEQAIDIGLPVIVNVKTIDWDHWQGEETYHAVVVVGIDHGTGIVYIHDPFFAESPIALSLHKFLNAWEEQERQYAIIGLTP